MIGIKDILKIFEKIIYHSLFLQKSLDKSRQDVYNVVLIYKNNNKNKKREYK